MGISLELRRSTQTVLGRSIVRSSASFPLDIWIKGSKEFVQQRFYAALFACEDSCTIGSCFQNMSGPMRTKSNLHFFFLVLSGL